MLLLLSARPVDVWAMTGQVTWITQALMAEIDWVVWPWLAILLRLYGPIGAGVCLGVGVSAMLRQPVLQRRVGLRLYQTLPERLGQFLFWIGIPLSIIGFTRRVDLSSQLLLAPLVAWLAMLIGLGCSVLWMQLQSVRWSRPRQGSFSLAAMLGNTGYIGYPVVLLLPQLGLDMFGWALFYDALGTLLGSYGLGAILASEYSGLPDLGSPRPPWQRWGLMVVRNPIILAFGGGLLLQPVPLPPVLETGLYAIAWTVVMLSLVLMGMRIQQIQSWQHLRPALAAVGIKMLFLPLLVGVGLTLAGIVGPIRLVLIVQAGMPCAFSNLVLAEAYSLDRDLSVTCVGLSSMALMLTLPLWLWGFAGG